MEMVKIKEIFNSIQGEGIFTGQFQTFIRFSKCNLNCKYCDTDFKTDLKDYTIDKLYNEIKNFNTETISFTGGEPLLEADFLYDFLKTYKKILNKEIYLETNGTLHKNLEKIIDFVDIISMDIKLYSATNEKNNFSDNEKFLDIAHKKTHFIKIVFDNKIDDLEIEKTINLAKKYNSLIILQPKMPMEKDLEMEKIFNKFFEKHKKIRLIPQIHKFLNLR